MSTASEAINAASRENFASDTRNSSAGTITSVTPAADHEFSDTKGKPDSPRGIQVSINATVNMEFWNGDTITGVPMLAGIVYAVRPRRITAATQTSGMTAPSVFAWY